MPLIASFRFRANHLFRDVRHEKCHNFAFKGITVRKNKLNTLHPEDQIRFTDGEVMERFISHTALMPVLTLSDKPVQKKSIPNTPEQFLPKSQTFFNL